MRLVPTILMTVGLVSAGGGLEASELRAAAARADITPEYSVDLWGYSDREGPATGTLDPLYAKVVVLDEAATRLALVTLDLGRTFGFASMNAVRERVVDSADVDEVFFFASHTHSGPVISDSYTEGKMPEWEQAALEKIGTAIEVATAKLVPAKIGAGYGETYIGHNRRLVKEDGTVRMLWRNASKMPTSPVDPRVGVIRIDAAGGPVIAVLVNYACHPVVLGPDNLQFSADFPGAMAKVVEDEFGEGALCLFLQGAAGDINPFYDKMAIQEDAVRLMKETGAQLGNEVVRVARDISADTPAHPSLKYRLDTLQFKMRWDAERILPMLKQRLKPNVYERYKSYLLAPLHCPVMTLLINGEIALMGMPGEPFVEFAVDFRARSPLDDAFFVGYANGYSGYFPTISAAVEGGYGADSVVARAEVGAGETMLDHAIVKLYELLGRLQAVPGS